MTIEDKIYGHIYLEEPVLQEVLLSKPVQRLQGLKQAGVSVYRLPELVTTRYEHSIGVMSLLRGWDASIEEQLAGLLHDVNHLAFSHVADIAFGDAHGQEFAEQFQRQVILQSEIPEIVERYGIEVEQLIDYKKQFPLLEQELPDICADRFDYGLRDAVASGFMSLEQAHQILDDVHIIGGQQIAFRSASVARLFGDQFRQLNAKRYVRPLEMTIYKYFADALRLALDKKIIVMEDLFLTDDEVWDKLATCPDPVIRKVVQHLPSLEVTVVTPQQDFDFHVKSKIRLIDPWVIVGDGDQTQRLSGLDSEYALENADYFNQAQDGYFVKVNAPTASPR